MNLFQVSYRTELKDSKHMNTAIMNGYLVIAGILTIKTSVMLFILSLMHQILIHMNFCTQEKKKKNWNVN
jgi:hypothetical membrane protein